MPFVSALIEPLAAGHSVARAAAEREPLVPPAFRWNDQVLEVEAIVRSWHTNKTDRGDVYRSRHWHELRLRDGRRARVYYDRHARSAKARWWLYDIT